MLALKRTKPNVVPENGANHPRQRPFAAELDPTATLILLLQTYPAAEFAYPHNFGQGYLTLFSYIFSG